jgi:hypothetical protein
MIYLPPRNTPIVAQCAHACAHDALETFVGDAWTLKSHKVDYSVHAVTSSGLIILRRDSGYVYVTADTLLHSGVWQRPR